MGKMGPVPIGFSRNECETVMRIVRFIVKSLP